MDVTVKSNALNKIFEPFQENVWTEVWPSNNSNHFFMVPSSAYVVSSGPLWPTSLPLTVTISIKEIENNPDLFFSK